MYFIELSTERDEWPSERYQHSKVEESCKQAERQLEMLSTKWAAWGSGQECEEMVTQMCNSKTGFKPSYLRVEKVSGLEEWRG